MCVHKNHMQVRIHLDEQTICNLQGMRTDRKKLGLSRKKLSELTGINYASIADYEEGRCAPHLSRYLLLAEIFGWDIKDSVNYIFANTTTKYDLKKRARSYGLSTEELSRLTNFSQGTIENALYMQKLGTLNGFAAILEVIQDEERRSKLTQELTRKSKI